MLMNDALRAVRPAREADLSRIAEILVFAKRTAYRSIFRDDAASFNDLQVLRVAESYRRNAALLADTLVYDDGIVKGVLRKSMPGTEPGIAELCELYVDPFFQQTGVGRALMAFFLEEAARQARTVRLWVIRDNARARAFYEAFGFAPTGEERLVEGTGVVEIRYRR